VCTNTSLTAVNGPAVQLFSRVAGREGEAKNGERAQSECEHRIRIEDAQRERRDRPESAETVGSLFQHERIV
jgi:hypothetical protein